MRYNSFMIRRFRATFQRFLALPPGEKALVAEAAAAVLLARAASAVLPPGRAAKAFRAKPRSRRHARRRVVWAVEAAAARLAGKRGCLARSLAAYRLLGASGYDAEIHIGLRCAGGSYDAHAWVVSEGDVLLGGPFEAYQVPPPAVFR